MRTLIILPVLMMLVSGCQIGTVSNSIFCEPPISTRRAAMVGAILAQGNDAVIVATEAYIRPVGAACEAFN